MTVLFKVQNVIAAQHKSLECHKFVCKVSSKNIIAFNKVELRDNAYEHIVCVMDLITPWESYTVCKNDYAVKLLEWTDNGESLLVVFQEGDIEMWKPKASSLNVWQLKYKIPLNGEEIVTLKFFHNGKCNFFNSQKRDFAPFSTCERLTYYPTLTKLGNAPVNGFLAVTFTGNVVACVLPSHSQMIDFSEEAATSTNISVQPICTRLGNVVQACIHYSPNGIVNIGFLHKKRKNVVSCFQLKLDFDHEFKIQIKSKKIPQLLLDHKKNIVISQLKWLMAGTEESLIVSYKCDTGAFMGQWILSPKKEHVHPFFKKNNETFAHIVWNNVAQVLLKADVKEFCISSFPCDYFPIYAILVDNSIQFFEGGLTGFNHFIFDSIRDDRYYGQKIIGAHLSALNQLMILFDNYGCMYGLQLFNPFQDKNYKPNNLSLLLALLEYSIKTGIDANDIFLSNTSLLDVLMEKLTDNFTRQQQTVKQYYYSSFLSMKSNLCRLQTKQHDFDNLIHLNSISIAFKCLLRPSDLSTPDKSPGENISNILNEFVPDIDKVLCNLDARDFTVEPSTLQSLQQVIQWVSDLTIIMLHKLPEEMMKMKHGKKQGYDMCRDAVAINLIRELLVIMRIWGLLNGLCLPVYIKSVENVDVLALVFRILTRLVQNGLEPDDVILDECNNLSSQVIIPLKYTKTPITIFNCTNVLSKNAPFLFSSSVTPTNYLDYETDSRQYYCREGKDAVLKILLGAKCSVNKQCLRCGYMNSVNKIEKTAAMKAWGNRWQICHCGGFWKSAKDPSPYF